MISLLRCLIAIVFLGITAPGTSAADSVSDIHIDSLYEQSDFVGFVTIIASEFRKWERGRRSETASLYKAEVKHVLRGDSNLRHIYFGRYSGSGLNRTYLVFLTNSGRTVAERLQRLRGQGNPIFDTLSAVYYQIMRLGYGSMETDIATYPPTINEWDLPRFVRVDLDVIIIPDSIPSVPISTTDGSPSSEKWVSYSTPSARHRLIRIARHCSVCISISFRTFRAQVPGAGWARRGTEYVACSGGEHGFKEVINSTLLIFQVSSRPAPH